MIKSLRNWFNMKVLLVAVAFALCVFGALLAILWSAKAINAPQQPGTAILNVIAAPTMTPLIPKTTQTATPTLEASSSHSTPLPSGDISAGDYVQVKGTEGDGLRLHATAGVASEVRYVALDSEVFLVKDGPVDADGYEWWLLHDPYTGNAVGWGVSNYLSVVHNP